MRRFILASCVALMVMAPVLALAQNRTPPSNGTSAGTASPNSGSSSASGSSGGSPSNPSGGSYSSGTGSGSGGYAGSGSVGTGPGGYNAPSSISRRGDLPRSGDAPGANAPSSTSRRGDLPRGGDAPGAYGRGESRTAAGVGQPVPSGARPRGDGPVTGYAQPRTSGQPPSNVPPGYVPPDNGGWYGGYYPYYPGYYPWYGWYGWYGPWYMWSGNLNPWNPNYMFYWYSPYIWFTPWSMWSDWGFDSGYGGGVYERTDVGSLRFKVKPKDAEIWVDGYFEGQASDKIQLKPGMHQVEIKAKGYETISVEIRSMPGRTVTYTADLKQVAVK
jgi:hypothetical protein